MTDAELLAVLKRVPMVAQLIYEIQDWDAHKDDPPFKRSDEEIQAALDRAYAPFWRRIFR